MCEFIVAVATTISYALLININPVVEEHFLVFSTQVVLMPNLTWGLLIRAGSRTEVASSWLYPLLQLSEVVLSLENFHLLYELVLFVFFSTASS